MQHTNQIQYGNINDYFIYIPPSHLRLTHIIYHNLSYKSIHFNVLDFLNSRFVICV